MLTREQEEWINTLDATRRIEIFPYDPTCVDKFEEVRQRIVDHFGDQIEVVHSGASSLGISGQREIDIYVPVPATLFDVTVIEMEKVFGPVRRLYPRQRARFWHKIDETKIELFVENKDTQEWREVEKFMKLLKGDAQLLSAYEKLKEECHGLLLREYYRKKKEFINAVV